MNRQKNRKLNKSTTFILGTIHLHSAYRIYRFKKKLLIQELVNVIDLVAKLWYGLGYLTCLVWFGGLA
jgi:hypothetical protein